MAKRATRRSKPAKAISREGRHEQGHGSTTSLDRLARYLSRPPFGLSKRDTILLRAALQTCDHSVTFAPVANHMFLLVSTAADDERYIADILPKPRELEKVSATELYDLARKLGQLDEVDAAQLYHVIVGFLMAWMPDDQGE